MYLSVYEEEFFKKYKGNNDFNDNVGLYIDDYLDNLIFDNKELLVMLELLKQIDYKIVFVTNVNELFFTKLFNKLNGCISDVIYLNDESNGDEISNSIYICNKKLKEVNSNLLIIINNK